MFDKYNFYNEYKGIAYKEFPRLRIYPKDFRKCTHNVVQQIIYCNGEWDIIRCPQCGAEFVEPCTFDHGGIIALIVENQLKNKKGF